MENIDRKEVEEQPKELSYLEREATELASDPNLWHAKTSLKTLDLLNSIATSLNILVKYNEERKAKEQEMMNKMGGFMGGIVPGAGTTMKNILFGRKIEKEDLGEDIPS